MLDTLGWIATSCRCWELPGSRASRPKSKYGLARQCPQPADGSWLIVKLKASGAFVPEAFGQPRTASKSQRGNWKTRKDPGPLRSGSGGDRSLADVWSPLYYPRRISFWPWFRKFSCTGSASLPEKNFFLAVVAQVFVYWVCFSTREEFFWPWFRKFSCTGSASLPEKNFFWPWFRKFSCTGSASLPEKNFFLAVVPQVFVFEETRSHVSHARCSSRRIPTGRTRAALCNPHRTGLPGPPCARPSRTCPGTVCA